MYVISIIAKKIAAERYDKAKLKTLLNHRLVDLMNLIMLNEEHVVDSL